MLTSLEPYGFVLLCLAAYRVTRFLVKDSLLGFGPDSGSRTSVRVDAFAYDDEGQDRSWLRGKIGDLLTCTYCLGFWVSLAALCGWLRLAPWELGVEGVVVVFAIAGVQGFLNSRMNA